MTEKSCWNCKYYRKTDKYCEYSGYIHNKLYCSLFEKRQEKTISNICGGEMSKERFQFDEGVCSICKHHYLEKTNMFYISKCEKGHEKCSKESVRHCEDFKLKELQE